MSYVLMQLRSEEHEAEFARVLAEAQATVEADDVRYRQGKRGDEWPEDLRSRKRRPQWIEEGNEVLEEVARQEAVAARSAADQPQAVPDALLKPKAQRVFTVGVSRFMRVGATKAFEQAINGQVAVDSEYQVVVDAGMSEECNVKHQVQPLVERMRANLGGVCPKRMSLDIGLFADSCG